MDEEILWSGKIDRTKINQNKVIKERKRIDGGKCPQCNEELDRDGYYCSRCLRMHNYNDKMNKGYYPEFDNEIDLIKKYLEEIDDN